MRGVRKLLTGAAIALVLAVSGSGTGPAEAPIDLRGLDTGGYETRPQTFAPKTHPDLVAHWMEGERLAEDMPLTSEIDPELQVNDAATVHSFIQAQRDYFQTMFDWLNIDDFETDTPGFLAGFTTTGQSHPALEISRTLSDTALLFDTDAQASAAAAALARSGFQNIDLLGLGPPPTTEATSSPRFPSAFLSWRPDDQVLAGWWATGRFVIVAVTQDAENHALHRSDLPSLVRRVEAAFALTAERLRHHPIHTAAESERIPLDPDGLLRITLPRPAGDSYINPPGVYSPRGDLHFAEDPAAVADMYRRAGVDRIAYGGTTLTRARDPEAARRLLAEDAAPSKFWRHADSPKGLPIAHCQEYHGPKQDVVRYWCGVSFGRYVADAWSNQLVDAQQRISAQYMILVNSR
ncbi:DUF7373 family lipoprotein [Nocardia sp. CDC160]|uniref:DUF7373 family lipoprotein n=1 Tax=Nocardia sp. CDC160 TaxID=3112166 RepID=UPI002DB97203|nr:hypothetical protein [Nocardia sp. CDC160]MEC3913266.1 hypothetical protein [Nocardia sp. CDC160]